MLSESLTSTEYTDFEEEELAPFEVCCHIFFIISPTTSYKDLKCSGINKQNGKHALLKLPVAQKQIVLV